MPRIIGRVVLVSSFLFSVSCQRSDLSESEVEAISNRPQRYDRFIALLKLDSPALLSSIEIVDGKRVFNSDAQETLLAEQTTVVESLQAMSSEIKILYKYQRVLNGIAIVAPKSLEEQFRKVDSVSYVEGAQVLHRMKPVAMANVLNSEVRALSSTSVAFTGAQAVREQLKVLDANGQEIAVDGSGTAVGVIDTGIDYTHKMFGGSGAVEEFNNNDPNVIEDGTFPTLRVEGGIDLVGTTYDSSASDFERHIPKPDSDPIDEGTHGTHVAGTVAGVGDGENTYDGMAPGAALYAIKVFGKDGATSDAVILAALEYAADPNNDFSLEDQLDVVNLSLGSAFGTPNLLYTEAVQHLSAAGTAVVAAAGNEGAVSYIVGAPSTAPSAISVAASIDNMDHNYKFGASLIKFPDGTDAFVEAVEASFTPPVATVDVTGKFVFIGLADQDLTEEQRTQLKGNVALIDRGIVNFSDKVKRAFEGGAIGAVIVNNVPTDPFPMGGDDEVAIPAIMISQAIGEKIRQTPGDVIITFKTNTLIEKPELIDTLTGFSSRGPRSVDALLKPEVAAPGSAIISAKAGAGIEGIKMSGTSMASPHVAGAVALLKQFHASLSSEQLKSLLMSQATLIDQPDQKPYPISHQGAGRISVLESAKALLTTSPQAISLGEVQVTQRKTLKRELTITNISSQPLAINLESQLDPRLIVTIPATLSIAAGESKTLDLLVQVKALDVHAAAEMSGYIFVTSNGQKIARVPVMGMVRTISQVAVEKPLVHASGPAADDGALVTVDIENQGSKGDALLFNLLGVDDRQSSPNLNHFGACDLQMVGYRMKSNILQIGVKTFQQLTSWNICEVSVLFDQNGDDLPEQELLGTSLANLSGNEAHMSVFGSFLTNAILMREIRRIFETQLESLGLGADYQSAIVGAQSFVSFLNSSVAVVNVDLAQVVRTNKNEIRFKVVLLSQEGALPEADDYLAKTDGKWLSLTVDPKAQAFVGLSDALGIEKGETRTLRLEKGLGKESLMAVMPKNATRPAAGGTDLQGAVKRAVYQE